MKGGRLGYAAALAAAGALALAPGVAHGAATHYQADSAHSGFVANGPNPPLGRKWVRRDLGVRVSYPVIAQGRVFVTAYAAGGSSSGYGSSTPAGPTFLHALDRSTGATVWVRQVATGGLPAYGDGRVYVLGTEALDAVSATTGERLWRTEMRGGDGSAPTADGSFVYASDGNSFYAVSADTGLVVRSRSGGGWSFTVVGDRVYGTRSGCGTIALFTRGLAEQVWSRSGPCNSSRAVPAGYHSLGTTPPNERLWARDSNGQTGLVVDALTSLGTEQFTSAGGVALAGELAFLRQAGAVQARNQATGVNAWTAAPGGQLRGSALAVRDAVWVTTGSGQLVALRRGDGAELFRTVLLPHQTTAADHESEVAFSHAGMAADENGLVVPYVNRLVALGPGADAPGIDDPDKVPAGQTQLSAAMKPRDFEFGSKAKVTGRVTESGSESSSSSSSGTQGHRLELQADAYPYDGVWQAVDTTTSEQYRDYSLDHRPDRNTRYRVVDTSTAPTVISKTFQAWVYPRMRLGLGSRSLTRLRVSTAISAPDYLGLNGKRLYVYRSATRRAVGRRIGSLRIRRTSGTNYRARGTLRVPSLRRRAYFFVCFKIKDTRVLTRLNGRKDRCGASRL